MWKIIKKSVDTAKIKKEKFSLSMKWEFKIEFANDSFWPYRYKFAREDCYFNEWLQDRWAKIFPLKWIKSGNTEIFLETNDIVIVVWERWNLMWEEKTFIDIINIKTEKKYRLFTKEVNLIYNEKDKIVVNAEKDWVFKTVYLDIETLEKLEEKTEWLFAFFKCVYNDVEDKWYKLDFNTFDECKNYKKWYFILKQIDIKGTPVLFKREDFLIKTVSWDSIDIWKILRQRNKNSNREIKSSKKISMIFSQRSISKKRVSKEC